MKLSWKQLEASSKDFHEKFSLKTFLNANSSTKTVEDPGLDRLVDLTKGKCFTPTDRRLPMKWTLLASQDSNRI